MLKLYNIHFCKKSEYSVLVRFINKHWRNGHIMGISKELFEFQHYHEGADYYDFAVAQNLATGEFDAVYGFIRSWKYDKTKTVPNVGWGAIWKVRNDIENPEIGSLAMELMKYIVINSGIDILASLGISNYFKSIAFAMHFKIGEMNQYYISNNNKHNYNIIQNPEIWPNQNRPQYSISQNIDLALAENLENSINPNKNLSYFRNRYELHPFFNYLFWGVFDNHVIRLLLVVRKIVVGDSCAFRIIDAIGSKYINKSIFNSVQIILQRNDAEYIDCMNAGVEKSFFEELGFRAVDRSRTIIPEHLNPIEYEYVPLEYAYTSEEPMVIFKGDGDQDRPNTIKEICVKG